MRRYLIKRHLTLHLPSLSSGSLVYSLNRQPPCWQIVLFLCLQTNNGLLVVFVAIEPNGLVIQCHPEPDKKECCSNTNSALFTSESGGHSLRWQMLENFHLVIFRCLQEEPVNIGTLYASIAISPRLRLV